MRIHTLEIEGFGPYRERQVIDLGAFEGDGLFVITGRTGAGKSTVLDAVLFALFDAVPRYDGAERSVRSDFCAPTDPTSVRLDFEVQGSRYRVTRSPAYERPKQRGTGFTLEKATALLEEWVGGAEGRWQAVEVLPRDVGPRVTDILGLNAAQFRQVILLAQGRFAEFLHADTKTRRGVLRSLFDTARHEALEKQLRELARAAEREVEQVERAVAGLLTQAGELVGEEPPGSDRDVWFAEHEATHAARAAQTRAASETADAQVRDAASAWEAGRRQEDARVRRDRAAAQVAALEARSEQIEQERRTLQEARRAAPIAAAASALERAERAADKAHLVAERAAAATAGIGGTEVLPASFASFWSDAATVRAAGVTRLRELASGLAESVGALRTALEIERGVPGLVRAVSVAEAARDGAARRQAALAERRMSAPAELSRLGAELAGYEQTAGELEARLAARDVAQGLVDAHGEVARLGGELLTAREAQAERSREALAAQTRHDALLRTRLRQSAAMLAEELAPGEPCPVCGSCEHPAPAAGSPDAVTDDDVDAAAREAQKAQARLGAASQVESAVSAALAQAQVRATGTPEEAAAALESAAEAVAGARAAAASAAQTRAGIENLRRRIEADREAAAAIEVEITRLAAAHGAAVEQLGRAREQIGAARGRAESVAALSAVLEVAQREVTALADARETEAARVREVDQRRSELTEAVAVSGFDSAEEAMAAALEATRLENLELSVATFDQALAAARGKLEEAGADEIPDEVADLAALEAAHREADSARVEAVRVATLAQERLRRLGELRTSFTRVTEGSGPLRERADMVRSLAATLEGSGGNTRRIRFESFVLAARLESIVAAANRRLLAMTSGQYSLQVDDGHQYRNVESGLGLRVADAHTGVSRSTASLSGGETFLASLALALGLAETVAAEAGGIQLDTLFIDEGFGALDADTLEIAMVTLEDLRSGGRVVGLISHVEAMKDDIPAQLRVTRLPDRSSRVEVVAPA